VPRFGSDANSLSQSIVGVTDEAGNALVETSVDFAASPLGVAARAQALFGVPNAQFNLVPPDTSAVLEDYENPLPYWSVENLSDGRLTAYSVFDTATSTWGVELDPTAGSANDSLTLKTRSYLLNDDNLSLRQKAFLTLAKSGTAAVSTQWNVVMTAEYFTAADASLTGGTAYAIGTALDTASFTTINGFTTAGTAVIGASAAYVDIKITLTCSANVTGTAKATLKSLLLQSSTPTGGGGGLLIVETFTSSTTWTIPTGVTSLVGAWAIGAGGGGGAGAGVLSRGGTITDAVNGGGGGGSGGMAYATNIPLGTATTISIGVGAGGAGGTAGTPTMGASANGGNGAVGGASTFGVFLTGSFGGGGTGGIVQSNYNATGGETGGGTAGNASNQVFAATGTAGQTGGRGSATGGGQSGGGRFFPDLVPPFATGLGTAGAAQDGISGTQNVTVDTGGTIWSALGTGGSGAGTGLLASGGGGGGSRGTTNSGGTAVTLNAYNGGTSPSGGAGGGGAWVIVKGNSTTLNFGGTVSAGNGGDAIANTGGGGGGGGGAGFQRNQPNPQTIAGSAAARGGNGGQGGSGLVVVAYIA
jgi:hypothetical protein